MHPAALKNWFCNLVFSLKKSPIYLKTLRLISFWRQRQEFLYNVSDATACNMVPYKVAKKSTRSLPPPDSQLVSLLAESADAIMMPERRTTNSTSDSLARLRTQRRPA